MNNLRRKICTTYLYYSRTLRLISLIHPGESCKYMIYLRKCHAFSVTLFLSHFSVMLFLSCFFCHAFSVTLFLSRFFCHTFLTCFSCNAFSLSLFTKVSLLGQIYRRFRPCYDLKLATMTSNCSDYEPGNLILEHVILICVSDSTTEESLL